MPGRKPVKKTGAKKAEDPLFPSTPHNYRIGGDIQPTRDLGRYVRWPRYVRVQRQRRVLLQRLKVPPAVNQFKHSLEKSQGGSSLSLLVP